VIHIFTNELREYYGLERLWRDSAEIEWDEGKPIKPVKPDRTVKNKSIKDKHI